LLLTRAGGCGERLEQSGAEGGMELLVGEGAHGGDGDPQFFEIGGAAVASLQMLLESLPCVASCAASR